MSAKPLHRGRGLGRVPSNERIRINRILIEGHVDISRLGSEIALCEAYSSDEVHGTDERHEFHVTRWVDGRNVGCAAVHVVAIFHATHLIVQFGTAVARGDADRESPMLTDRVEHAVHQVFDVADTLLRNRVANPKRHGCVAMGEFFQSKKAASPNPSQGGAGGRPPISHTNPP